MISMDLKELDDGKSGRANEPLLGIFWYLDGLWITFSLYIEEGIERGGTLYITPYDHCSCWEELKEKGKVPDVDYSFYPRGRNFYNMKTKKWHFIGDHVLMDDENRREELKSIFRIPDRQAVFESNIHYQSGEDDNEKI